MLAMFYCQKAHMWWRAACVVRTRLRRSVGAVGEEEEEEDLEARVPQGSIFVICPLIRGATFDVHAV